MTARRPARFDLAAAVRDKGFTPRRADAGALADLLATDDDDLADAVERALATLGDAAAEVLVARFPDARAPLRGRIVRAVGRIAPAHPARWGFVRACLADDDAKARRNAVTALGRGGAPGAEDDLLAYWAREARVDHRRSVAAALGKVGGERALALLRGVATDDPELRRIVDQAVAMLARGHVRGEASVIDGAVPAAAPTPVEVHCRDGLEDLLAEELGPAWQPRVRGPGVVRATLTGPLDGIFRARTMTWFGFELPPEAVAKGEEADAAVARALASDAARAVFEAWTRGPVRYRLAWAEGGHKRAAVWRVARAVEARRPGVVNDPRESVWEAVVTERGREVAVALRPRRLADPRFAYRRGDVPAASHPTLAAALARVAGAAPGDVVWDPFAGSGLELVERALLGPYARMVCSDIDPAALDVAEQNLAAASVGRVELIAGDACTLSPRGVTLVITNPPLGRRVGAGEDVPALLDRFVAHVARVLVGGGRFVWVAPFPTRARAAAERAGLVAGARHAVDMGGFRAEIQRYTKPRAGGA